jgi:hypothetical protein
MKQQSRATRVRPLKTTPPESGEGTPIKPKSSKPQEDRSNRRKPLYQLIQDHIAHTPVSDSIQGPKLEKELAK